MAAEQVGVRPALSLDERNDILLDGIEDIFRLKKGRSWDEIRRNLSSDQVRQLYKIVATIWPPNTNIETILPEPDPRLRALYLGMQRPEMILENIVRYSLYCDEILVVDPFINPWYMKSEYSPLVHPEQYKSDVLQLLAFMITLEPWIRSRIVRIIPDPGGIKPRLRSETWRLAERRVKSQGPPSLEDLEDLAPIARSQLARELWRGPRDYHERLLREAVPGITDTQIQSALSFIERRRNEDPLILTQPAQWGESEFFILRASTNLEMGLFIAQATGAFPYTNLRRRWKELLSVARKLPEDSQTWTPLTHAFQQLEFKFLNSVDPRYALSLHKDGRLEQFRAFLRRVWQAVAAQADPNSIDARARRYSDELNDEYRKAQAEWDKIDIDTIKFSTAGLAATGALIISGHMLPAIPALGFSITEVLILLQSSLRRRSFKKSVPMSVFLELSGRKAK